MRDTALRNVSSLGLCLCHVGHHTTASCCMLCLSRFGKQGKDLCTNTFTLHTQRGSRPCLEVPVSGPPHTPLTSRLLCDTTVSCVTPTSRLLCDTTVSCVTPTSRLLCDTTVSCVTPTSRFLCDTTVSCVTPTSRLLCDSNKPSPV